MDISKEYHANFDQLHRGSPPQQQIGKTSTSPRPSQRRPFNPSIHDQKASISHKEPPFHPPSPSIPCLASLGPRASATRDPFLQVQTRPRPRPLSVEGKGDGGAGDDVRQTYCVPPPRPSIAWRRGRPSDAAAVGCCPARPGSPVSEADWESCHVCPCINMRRAACW